MECALKACVSLGHIINGTIVLRMVFYRSLDSDLMIGNLLIDMHSKSYDAYLTFK